MSVIICFTLGKQPHSYLISESYSHLPKVYFSNTLLHYLFIPTYYSNGLSTKRSEIITRTPYLTSRCLTAKAISYAAMFLCKNLKKIPENMYYFHILFMYFTLIIDTKTNNEVSLWKLPVRYIVVFAFPRNPYIYYRWVARLQYLAIWHDRWNENEN